MRTFDGSIRIAVPREQVWRVLAAVVEWPKWLPTVSAVVPLDGDPLRLGSRYIVRQPRLRPANWTVTELEPPRNFTWQARSPGLLMIADHEIEETPSGAARVVLRFSFGGLLGAPVAWLFGDLTEQYLAQELASLKLVAERQPL